MTTKEIEFAIFKRLKKLGTYLSFEVAMPSTKEKYAHRERVDLLSYDTSGIWRFYEIKCSVSDFRSKCKKTFFGNYNYFVLPEGLYEKVKQEIPPEIGVYIVKDLTNCYKCECVKKAKKKELTKFTSEQLIFSMMQSLSREFDKNKFKEMRKSGFLYL